MGYKILHETQNNQGSKSGDCVYPNHSEHHVPLYRIIQADRFTISFLPIYSSENLSVCLVLYIYSLLIKIGTKLYKLVLCSLPRNKRHLGLLHTIYLKDVDIQMLATPLGYHAHACDLQLNIPDLTFAHKMPFKNQNDLSVGN